MSLRLRPAITNRTHWLKVLTIAITIYEPYAPVEGLSDDDTYTDNGRYTCGSAGSDICFIKQFAASRRLLVFTFHRGI